MWRIKSSLMSTKNSDPPASNRRDPDDDGVAVVMDRPLTYSNVTAASAKEEESSSDNEEGITVVPAVDEEGYDSNSNRNMKEDNLSELSMSPNEFTDSLLDAMNKLEEKDNDESLEDYVENETHKFKSLKIEKKEEQEDDDEGILVDELTKEEEDFLDGLNIEPGTTSKTSETVNAKELVVVQALEKEIVVYSPPLEESLLKVQAKESEITEQPSKLEGEPAKADDEWVRPCTQKEEKVTKALLAVFHVFTVVLSVASFVALAFSSSPEESLIWNGDLDTTNVRQEPTMTDDNLRRPSATPASMMVPLIQPSHTNTTTEHTSTSLYNISGLLEAENGGGFLDGVESDPADSTWNGTQDILLVVSTLVFYYMIFFWIRWGGPSATGELLKLKLEGGFFHQTHESSSLNSFQGMLSFHKCFVKSGKGRRGTVRGKCDVSSAYDKLTRHELLEILDGFGRYKGRTAAKSTLIRDLCSSYQDTLCRFSNDQILQILQTKGYTVDTKMTKHQLVTLAVIVGF